MVIMISKIVDRCKNFYKVTSLSNRWLLGISLINGIAVISNIIDFARGIYILYIAIPLVIVCFFNTAVYLYAFFQKNKNKA